MGFSKILTPPLSPPGVCLAPPPPALGAGGGHTRWVERGWGVNILEDARHNSVLYFVPKLHCKLNTSRSHASTRLLRLVPAAADRVREVARAARPEQGEAGGQGGQATEEGGGEAEEVQGGDGAQEGGDQEPRFVEIGPMLKGLSHEFGTGLKWYHCAVLHVKVFPNVGRGSPNAPRFWSLRKKCRNGNDIG